MTQYTEGGDPVCWLSEVCPECGAFIEGDECTRCAEPEREESGHTGDP